MPNVTLKVEAHLTPGQMRKLNPHLKRKRLTVQQAIERGLKKKIPMSYLNMAMFLAALEAVGLSLDNNGG